MKKYYFLIILVLCLVFVISYNFVFEKEPSVKILSFGDVMFDRGVRNIIENRDRDPFEYIKKDLNIFGEYNVFVVNLEGPITNMRRSDCQQKAYNFQFSPDTINRLESIGVNMVNLANNHTYDCYRKGLDDTKKYLASSSIEYIGDSNLERSYLVKEISGKKVAFLGIDETIQVIPLSRFYPLIQKLKSENDLVVLHIHWGREYELKNDLNQRNIAYKLIDSGADIIFGHHPHVVQNMEVYKGKAIFYSLGNFVFDQNFGDTTVGLGVKVDFRKTETVFELFPFNMKAFAPDLMKEEERNDFCQKFIKDIEHKDCRFVIKL